MSTTILLILMACIVGIESDKENPKPYPIGTTGDTLMVRIIGYSFCPRYCTIDHHHTGHFNNYDCEEEVCNHLTINNE